LPYLKPFLKQVLILAMGERYGVKVKSSRILGDSALTACSAPVSTGWASGSKRLCEAKGNRWRRRLFTADSGEEAIWVAMI
jgi:hypothetical protein